MAAPRSGKVDRRNTRWEAHRRERRRELTEAAISAVLKHGYDTSMDQIAEESKTSKSILYKYFGDKEGLQYAIGNYVIGGLVATIEEAVEREAPFKEILDIVINEFFQLVDEAPALYRFQKVAEFEDDPQATLISRIDRSMIQAWTRLFYMDAEITNNEYHEGVVYAWLVGMISLVKGLAEAWLVVREVTSHPDEFAGAELSKGQANFALMDRELLQKMLVRSLLHMVEEIVVDTYTLLTGGEITDEKRAELEEHVREFSPAYED